MSALRAAAEDCLAMRRSLGFKLDTQGRHLMSFIEFCETRQRRAHHRRARAGLGDADLPGQQR